MRNKLWCREMCLCLIIALFLNHFSRTLAESTANKDKEILPFCKIERGN
jgi:hypothetical protein